MMNGMILLIKQKVIYRNIKTVFTDISDSEIISHLPFPKHAIIRNINRKFLYFIET